MGTLLKSGKVFESKGGGVLFGELCTDLVDEIEVDAGTAIDHIEQMKEAKPWTPLRYEV